MDSLLSDTDLANSPVVANNAMNRERGCAGPNSYRRDLGLNPIAFLTERLASHGSAAWLDICCGRARALVEAATHFSAADTGTTVDLVGIDLVPYFDPLPAGVTRPRLVDADVAAWEPGQRFDLITCVHGLHYLGDKLGIIARVCSWLAPDGLFLANLDLGNLLLHGAPNPRRFAQALRAAGLGYSATTHLVRCSGARTVVFPFVYLGADDSVGPNYTGQPAVGSWYAEARV